MGYPGTKPVASTVRQLRGDRPDLANPLEPIPEQVLKTAPAWLNSDQKKIWDKTITEVPEGMLRSLDEELLASFCVAVVARQTAVEEFRKNPDLVITTKKGNVIASPYIGIINRQTLIIAKLSSELGFSPTSRTRLKVPGKKGSKNRFADHSAKRAP